MEVGIDKKVLTIIDMQPYYLKDRDEKEKIQGICKLIDKFKQYSLPIALVEVESVDSTIPEIKNKVHNYHKTKYIYKYGNDGSCHILAEYSRDKIFVTCGIYTEYCVSATVRGLVEKHADVELVKDLCCPWDDSHDPFRFLNTTINDYYKIKLKYVEAKNYEIM